jgi:hypothetical protein
MLRCACTLKVTYNENNLGNTKMLLKIEIFLNVHMIKKKLYLATLIKSEINIFKNN